MTDYEALEHPICIVCHKEIDKAADLEQMSDLVTGEPAGFSHRKCCQSDIDERVYEEELSENGEI